MHFRGIYFQSGTFDNTVGGTSPGSGNVISANRNGGIWITGGSDDLIEGNLIYRRHRDCRARQYV